MGVCCAIDHIKAASSLAMATTMTLFGLPLLAITQKRLVKRTWAFQAISRIGSGTFSCRFCISRLTLAGKR